MGQNGKLNRLPMRERPVTGCLGAAQDMVRDERGGERARTNAPAVIGWLTAALLIGGGLQAGEDRSGESKGVGIGRVESDPEPAHGGVRKFAIGEGPRSYW